MEELEVIVQRMIDAGESEENIKLVIQDYDKVKDNPEPVKAKGETAEVEDGGSASTSAVDSSSSESPTKPVEFNQERFNDMMARQSHPELFTEMDELNATINSRPIMADNSVENKRLEEIKASIESLSAPKKSGRKIATEQIADLDSQMFELEKKADRLSKNGSMSFEEILESDGTYQDLLNRRRDTQNWKSGYDQVLEELKKDTNGDQTNFFGKIGRVFGINAGTNQEADEIIDLNEKVEEQILLDISDRRTREKIGSGYATLEEKEKIITDAKYKVLINERRNIINEAKAANQTLSDEGEKRAKLEELDNRYNTLLGEVGFDQAEGILKNNFKKTTNSQKFDEMVSGDGFFHETTDAVSSLLEGIVQTGFKGTVGFTADMMSGFGDTFTDQEGYSVYDAFSDTVNQLGNYNYLPSSKAADTRIVDEKGDFNINYKTVSKSLAQTLPFTLAIINDVKKGKVSNIEAKLGRLLNPNKSAKITNSLKLIDSAYRHTLSDNLNMAEDLGLDDNQGRIFANTLSMAEGMAELIMPDTKFFKTTAGDAILNTFKGDLKKAATTQALKQTVKNFTGNIIKELGEEEVILATQDLLKYSMVVGHENSDFWNIKNQKELAAATVIMSGTLGGANIRRDFQGNMMEAYKQISDNINGVTDELRAELDSGFHNEEVTAEINKSIEWANNLHKAIKTAPVNVTGEQIDLLMEKSALLTEMKSVDDAFHPQYKAKIEAINNKINPLNEKENSKTDTEKTKRTATDSKTATKEAVKSESKKEINKAKDTQGFFGDVVQGNKDKYKPAKSYEYEQEFNESQSKFKENYDADKGNFDEHIATSIPTFRDNQVKKGNAIVETLAGQDGALVIDIGGSEGGFGKAITKTSNGNIRTINVDPNSNMKESFDATPVEGAMFEQAAFKEGFDDVPVFEPTEKADVVHESMVFQFITPERKKFLDEVASKYIKEDGMFITEEKFKMDDDAEYKANEELKNKNHKAKYYTEEQQKLKGEDVLVGMDKNQANYNEYISELESRFDHVGTYWTSGNFRGVVATNSKEKFDKFMKSVGDNSNDYTVAPKTKAEKLAAKVRSAKIYKNPSDALSKLQSNPAGLLVAAWDGALETVATAIEAGGSLDSSIRKGLKVLKQSDWYKGLNLEAKKKAVIIADSDLRKSLTPLAESVQPKSKQTVKSTVRKSTGQTGQSRKVTISEARLLKEKFKNLAKGSKIGAKSVMDDKRAFIKDVSTQLKSLVNSKVMTTAEATRILSAVNQFNGKNIDKVQPLVDKVIDAIEKKGLSKNIKSKKSKLRKASKSSRNPVNIREMAKASIKINEKYLDVKSQKRYDDILDKITKAVATSTTKGYNMANTEAVYSELNELNGIAESNRLKELAETMGLEGQGLTEAELKAIWESDNVDEYISQLKEEKAKAARLALEKQAEYALIGLKDIDSTNLSEQERKDVRELKNADLTLLSSTDIRDLIKIVDNIILNENFASSGEVVSKVRAYTSSKEAMNNFSKDEVSMIRKSAITDLKSLALIFKKVFMSTKKSAAFNRLSGLNKLSMSYTKHQKSMNKLADDYNKLFKTIKKKNSSILKPENTLLRGLVGQLIQGSTNEDFNINKSRVEDHLVQIKKNQSQGLREGAEKLQQEYDKLKDFKSQDEVIEYTKGLKDGNWDIIDFWLKHFESTKDALKYNTEVVHGKSFEEVSGNYLPIKMKGDIQHSVDVDNEAFFNTNGLPASNASTTTISRTKSKKLPKDRILDLDFDSVMFNKASAVSIDIETSKDYKDVFNFFRSPNMEEMFGRETLNVFNSKVKDMRRVQLGVSSMDVSQDEITKNVTKVERMWKSIGTSIALGGLTQYPKQYVSVVTNIIPNLGKHGGLMFKAMFTDKSNMPILDKVSISLRGDTQGGTVTASTRISEAEKKATKAMVGRIVQETGLAAEKVRNALFFSLRKGDVNVAKSSWVAFYQASLLDQGVDSKDIDMTTEHERMDDVRRQQAISYAELKVEETQIASDDSRGSEFYQSKTAYKAILRSMFLPFQSFNINSKMRMLNDLNILGSQRATTEQKLEAGRSLLGTTSEMVTFQTMKYYVLAPLIGLGKDAIIDLFNLDSPDEDEEQKSKFKFKQWYSALAKDLNPLTIGAFAEDMNIEILNYLQYLQDGDSDEQYIDYIKRKNKDGDGQLFYRYKDKAERGKGFGASLLNGGGLYAIPMTQFGEASEVFELMMNGTKRDDYGNLNEYDFDNNEKAFLRVAFALELTSMFGLGEADTRRIFTSIRRDLLRNTDKKKIN